MTSRTTSSGGCGSKLVSTQVAPAASHGRTSAPGVTSTTRSKRSSVPRAWLISASGLCARCHPHAPGQLSPAWKRAGPLAQQRVVIDGCPDCDAWGVTRTYGWVCMGCKSWRETHHNRAACATCQRVAALADDGSCRLCHKQRSHYAHRLGARPSKISLAEANADGQQLFFAGMWNPKHGHGKTPYVKTTMPADLALLRPVSHRQLVLLDLPRDLKAGLRNGFPPPRDAALEAAFHQFVRDYAAARGWKRTKTEHVHRAVRILLGIQDTPGAAIRRSDVALLSRIKYSAAVVADVLAAAGMLEEDRQPAVVRWFNATVADLPAPMRRELDVWFDVMRNGSSIPPRRVPRAENTIGTQLRWALPTLHTWANGHQSLREIGRDDVTAALPDDPMGRYTTMQGLRSIFRILKGRKLVFVNPTVRIQGPLSGLPRAGPGGTGKATGGPQLRRSGERGAGRPAGLPRGPCPAVARAAAHRRPRRAAVSGRAGHPAGPTRTAAPDHLPGLPAAYLADRHQPTPVHPRPQLGHHPPGHLLVDPPPTGHLRATHPLRPHPR